MARRFFDQLLKNNLTSQIDFSNMSLGDSFVFGVTGGIEYSLYQDSDWPGVEKVLDSYYKNEMDSIGTEVNLPKSELARAELNVLCVDALRDGISVVARDVHSNRIVGTAINKMLYLGDDPDDPGYYAQFRDTFTSPNARAYMDFMVMIDAMVNMFDYFNTDCVFDFMFMGTLPEYGRHGIGTRMIQHSVDFARQLNRGDSESLKWVSDEVRTDPRRPAAVTGIFTSAFSQRIAHHVGMQEMASVSYDRIWFEGRSFSDRIQDDRHTHAELLALGL